MRRLPPGARGSRDRGVVLVSVLVAIVLLLLVAGLLDSRVERWRDEQLGWRSHTQTRLVLEEARESVTLALLTQPLKAQGFGPTGRELRVDGRWYRLPSGVRVSVQDQRGLLSMATPDPALLRAWLLQQGIDGRRVATLVDSLLDYIDTDDLTRLNGAEAEAYRAAGLPPPRNDWPISPYELRQVFAWHEHPELWTHAGDHFTAVRDAWINVNTAPRAVLGSLPGASEAGIAALLAARETRHLATPEDVLATSGLRLPDDPSAFHPGIFMRVRLRSADGHWGMEYTHLLTPDAPAKPWLTLEVRPLVVSLPDGGSIEAQPFPWTRSDRVPPAPDPLR